MKGQPEISDNWPQLLKNVSAMKDPNKFGGLSWIKGA